MGSGMCAALGFVLGSGLLRTAEYAAQRVACTAARQRVTAGALANCGAAPHWMCVALLQGDALYAMELALSLEKLNFQKLRQLHSVADEHGDASMADFVEGELLNEQVGAGMRVAVWDDGQETSEARTCLCGCAAARAALPSSTVRARSPAFVSVSISALQCICFPAVLAPG